MARRMLMKHEHNDVMLSEVAADNEAQLQELLRNSPDLLPIDEFGLEGTLLIVGRETILPSGAADLLALAPTGDVLVVEMKTGPQNSDFRAALAQATDYGADLWQMTPETFEATVLARYCASGHCDPAFKGITLLAQAAKVAWPTMTDEEYEAFRERLIAVLTNGEFNFVIVAQDFTESMITTATYLNAIVVGRARYFLVELVRFAGDSYSAFEARTILRPTSQSPKASGPSINETALLDSIADPAYRQALERLFETSHGLDLRFHWGVRGTSIRVPTPHRQEPISAVWAFPPGVSGWMGLCDVTCGYDLGQIDGAEGALAAFDSYKNKISQIAGAHKTSVKGLVAYNFSPAAFTASLNQIIEALASLTQEAAGG